MNLNGLGLMFDVLFRLADFEADVGASVSTEEIEALKLESDTWGLLQAIMP